MKTNFKNYNYFDIRKITDDLYKKMNKPDYDNLKDEELETSLKNLDLIINEAKIFNEELLKIKEDNLAGLEYLNQFLISSNELKRLLLLEKNKELKNLYIKIEKHNEKINEFNKSFKNEYKNKNLLEKLIFGNTEEEKQKHYDYVKKLNELKKEKEEINNEIEKKLKNLGE